MPDKSSRGERGGGKLPQPSFGHGRGSERSPLPRRDHQPDARRELPRDSRPELPRTPAGLPGLDPIFWQAIDAGLTQLGEGLTDGARSAIDAQARLLLAWNAHVNLTALRQPEQIARGHVLDSLSALPLLRRLTTLAGKSRLEPLRILDLGSGAGYPGLPVAVALPVGRCALVESVGKKAAFLGVVAAAAEEQMRAAGEQPPRVFALAARAEDLADEPDHREAWDIVLARAVGSMAEVAELALPLLCQGGHLLAWKSDGGDALAGELASAGGILQAAGGSLPRVAPADPTGRLGFPDHRLVTVSKLRSTPQRFPRSPAERRRAALLT